MGKNKRQKLQSGARGTKKKLVAKGAKPTGVQKSQRNNGHQQQQQQQKKKHTQPSQSAPVIPFSTSDRILLIGEGDLSFARSLITHHACKDVLATMYEKSIEELREKYPLVQENVTAVEEGGGKVKYGVDATKGGGVWKELEKKGGVDRIVFNFPHVGGKTKDVNRQVRYNQELLVAFFRNALTCLAPSSPASTSSIIVTLFEGEPYTLWNIRDLGRHAGLQVERSFRFQAAAYEGYKHARTLGVVKSKNGAEGGGWRGEERSARSYVFVRKGEGQPIREAKKNESSDEDEEEDMDTESFTPEDIPDKDEEASKEEREAESEAWDGIHDSSEDENALQKEFEDV